MSLQDEISDEYLPDIHVNGMDCPDTESAKDIINKVLDAVSMECIPGNIDDGNDYLKGWNQALDHTQSVINKLRPES